MGLYFRLEVRNWAFKTFCCVHFTANQGHQEWKISPNLLEIQPKLVKITMRVRRVSATLSVFKWSGAIFRPRSSKLSVQKVLLGPFYWKLRPSGISLESSELENIPRVPANRAKDAQNQDASKAVSAALSFLKWTRLYFGPEAQKWALKSFAVSISMQTKACVHITEN